MGWSVYGENMSKQEFVKRVVDDSMSPWDILDYAVRSNAIYMAVRKNKTIFNVTNMTFSCVMVYQPFRSRFFTPEIRGKEEVFIGVTLISKIKGMGWGEKSMSEASYPYYFDCPEKILKLSTSTDESSVNWRENCRVVRKKKAELAKMVSQIKTNTLLLLNNREKSVVIFKRVYNKGATQFVAEDINGKIYRYPSLWIDKILDFNPSFESSKVS